MGGKGVSGPNDEEARRNAGFSVAMLTAPFWIGVLVVASLVMLERMPPITVGDARGFCALVLYLFFAWLMARHVGGKQQ